MGNSSSDTMAVKAPKDLDANERFNAGARGVLWINLQAPKHKTTKRDEINAKINGQTKIKSCALQTAAQGNHYDVGDLYAANRRFTYRVPGALNTTGVKKGQDVTVFHKDLDLDNTDVTYLCENPDLLPDIPGIAQTGVQPHITKMCASLSNQIYKARLETHFRIDNGGVVLFDSHGGSNDAIPAFAIAVSLKTMIMVWRGTNRKGSMVNCVLDVVSDLAIGPVVCSELGAARRGIRVHNAWSSFAASDLDTHKDFILQEIKDKEIDQVVFTGHSMGGGIASIAHHIFQAQILGHYKSNDTGSDDTQPVKETFDGAVNPPPLKKLKVTQKVDYTDVYVKKVKLNSVLFSAPSSLKKNTHDSYANKGARSGSVDHLGWSANKEFVKSAELIKKVSENSVNFMFGCDVFPRLFSNLAYLPDVIDALATELREREPFLLGMVVNKVIKLDDNIEALKQMGQDIRPVVAGFRHTGKLLYYADIQSVPIVLTDTGPITEAGIVGDQMTYKDDSGPIESPNPNKYSLNHYTFHHYETGTDVIAALSEAHGYPEDLLASHVCTADKTDSNVGVQID